jgi:flavodoxin
MSSEKILVVYYSRTGTTAKVADAIKKNLNCDVEQVMDAADRKGIIGYIKSGRDAIYNKTTTIGQIKYNPASYDHIIIGTPVWASRMTPAIRTYIEQNKDNFKKVSFFCTQGGSGGDKVISSLQELCGKKPENTVILSKKDIISHKYLEKIASL